MNIKGIVGNLIPIDILKTDRRKTQNTSDRDPQQGGGGDAQPEQHRFTDSELQDALKLLKDLPGIKENHLQFRVERNDKRVVVFVEDSTGKVIRRIPDTELWYMLKNRQHDQSRGNLLNKAL
ncbi:MAG: flagellar protein FlaG [Oligoflexia bacterium]|nr:flagellar protein FlaG [Oligoflexia bacterium]